MSNRELDEIFERVSSSRSLFKNRNALRNEFIPERLPFREKQISAVAEILAPVLRHDLCSNLLLYGKTGTGKTAVAKLVTGRLEERARRDGVQVGFVYTNTRLAKTEYRILADLANSTAGVNVPFTGLASGEVLNRALHGIEANKKHVIMVMDEIDFFTRNIGDNLLYGLTRANTSLNQGSLSLIGISNDLQFKEYLDPRVLSSLSEEEIVFPPYTVDELRVILTSRSHESFCDSVVKDSAVNLCAALAGSEHGDARRAVDLLRVAGEVAERTGAKQVDESHVRVAIQKIEQDRLVDALKTLPLQEKALLLAIVRLPQTSSTGETYNSYTSICAKIGLEPLTHRRISSLLGELDLLGLISTEIVNQGRYGRTKKIKCLMSHTLIQGTLAEEPLLSSLS